MLYFITKFEKEFREKYQDHEWYSGTNYYRRKWRTKDYKRIDKNYKRINKNLFLKIVTFKQFNKQFKAIFKSMLKGK